MILAYSSSLSTIYSSPLLSLWQFALSEGILLGVILWYWSGWRKIALPIGILINTATLILFWIAIPRDHSESWHYNYTLMAFGELLVLSIEALAIAVFIIKVNPTHFKKIAWQALGISFILNLTSFVGGAYVTAESISETQSHEGGVWHFDNFEQVRVFRINWGSKYPLDGIMDDQGQLNPTRIPKEGVLLHKHQVNRLESAVTGTHPAHPIALCFNPHHAFLFYDKHGQVVGNIDLCFLCSNYEGSPSGYADYWDLEALRRLLLDLDIPIENDAWNQDG